MTTTASTSARRARRWLILSVIAVGVIAAAAAGGLYWRDIRDATVAFLVARRNAPGEKPADGEHGHEHAGHEHRHDDANSLHLSRQAQDSLGLKWQEVKLDDYDKTIDVPGMVVERPGRSRIEVSAPLTGVLTRVFPIQGEALAPGQRLFELRMTHEELVQAQGDFLRTTEELDVVRQEIARLEGLADLGAVSRKTLLERQYERQKLEASLRAQRQALLLHGLTAEQIDEIERNHELVRGMSVYVPAADMTEASEATERLFQVQQLAVDPGQHVEAGQTLCVLADYEELYIEGRVFERELRALQRTAEKGWKLSATPAEDGHQSAISDLDVFYVSDQVNAETRTLNFYVRLPNSVARDFRDGDHRFVEWRFKPGQRLQLHLPVERWTDQIVLPAAAVVRDGVEHYVFRQNGDHFDRQAVRVRHRDPRSVVLANDGSVFPGDRVVTAGAQQMQLALKSKSGPAVDPHAGHSH